MLCWIGMYVHSGIITLMLYHPVRRCCTPLQVFVFHALAFAIGYVMARSTSQGPDGLQVARCISLETGMQVCCCMYPCNLHHHCNCACKFFCFTQLLTRYSYKPHSVYVWCWCQSTASGMKAL